MSLPYHKYGGVRIPVITGKSARAAYNLPDDQIDQLRCDTLFDGDGDCRGDGFRGTPFESSGIPVLDEQECKERAEFLEREKASILHLFEANAVPVKDQNGHGYCWAYGAISALEAAWLVSGRAYRELDPHSIASYVKNGRDQGGWANQALKPATDMGVVPAGVWPRHSRNHRLWNQQEIRDAAKPYRPLEWVDIPRGDMPILRSLLCSNMACGMGLMWWGHLIMFGVAAWSDRFGWLYGQRNSHGPRFGWKGWAFHTEASARHGGGSTVRVAA